MIEKVKKKIPLDNPFRLYYHHIKGIVANMRYGNPSRDMIVIGVTWTNGKTTTTNLIAKWLKSAGKKVFMFSTVNYIIGDTEYVNETKFTSPDPFLLQKLLQEAKIAWCTHAVIETSSHAIIMNRVWGIAYDILVLTNITQDHLDLHRTMESYVQTKLSLFKKLIVMRKKSWVKKSAVINFESDYKDLFINETYDSLLTYGKDFKTHLRFENVEQTLEGSFFDVKIAGWVLKIKTKLRGEFNIYNVMAAIGAFISVWLKPEEIERVISEVTGVPGRLEEVKNNEWFMLFIDYAHTPDALEKVLTTIKEINWVKRIITVFWATGDRDKTKRPEMGRIVSELSDVVILTQDDDYSEKTESIIKDILPGIERKEGENFWIIPDRKEAIRTALVSGQKDDAIIITWKGDEHTIVLNDGSFPWHDKTIAMEILKGIDDNKLVTN